MRNFLKERKQRIALAGFMFFFIKGLIWLGLVYFGFSLMEFAPLS
jgi:hypothetical protein